MSDNLSEAAAMLSASLDVGDTGDVSEEISDVSEATETVDEGAGQLEQTEDAAPPPEEDEQKTAAKLRSQKLQEQIAALKAKNSERTEAKRLAQQKAELEELHDALRRRQAETQQAHEEAESQRKLWRQALRDPVKAFREIGIDAPDAYQRITDAMLKRDNPASKEEELQEKLLSKLREQFEPKVSEVERLKAEIEQLRESHARREQMEMATVKRSAEREFLNVVQGSGYEVLADYYEDEELVSLGNILADEFASSGRRFSVQDVAAELKGRLETQLRRAEEKRNKRTAPNQSVPSRAAEQGKAPTAKANKPSGTTISNDLAAASGTSTRKPGKSAEERLADAERELSLLFDR
jgi:molecular chaperone GrpE (heat shock protein)